MQGVYYLNVEKNAIKIANMDLTKAKKEID